jgi:ABC-type multidrug transport system fused ATPase/permease subunit
MSPVAYLIISLCVSIIATMAIVSMQNAAERDKHMFKFEVTAGQMMVTIFFCIQIWWLINLQLKMQEYDHTRKMISGEHTDHLSSLQRSVDMLEHKTNYHEYRLDVHDSRYKCTEVWQTLITLWFKTTSIYEFWQELKWRIDHWNWTRHFPPY